MGGDRTEAILPEIPFQLQEALSSLGGILKTGQSVLGDWTAHLGQTAHLGHVCVRAHRSTHVSLKLLDVGCPFYDNPTV